jgi:membrane peptidoglycan carboxypeptidase
MTEDQPRRRPPAKPRPKPTPQARRAPEPEGRTATKQRPQPKKKAAPRQQRASWRVWLRRLTFAAVLLGVASVGIGFVALNSVKIPDPTRTVKTTSFVCLADVADGECSPSNSVAQFSAGGSNRVIIDIGDMSANLINAVVAAEDRSFFTHGGVDPWGIARALYRDLRGSASRQGGSTITQQYVKSVYLTADRTPERKLKEAAIAIKLERKLTKPEILERYLNEVPLGRGAIGVEAASRAYFDKDAADLTVSESAFIAGLIRAPRYADDPSDPSKPEENKEATRRRQTVLDAMLEEKYITKEEAEAAAAEPLDQLVLQTPPATTGPIVKKTFADVGGKYITEWTRQQLKAMPNVGETKLLEQGLKVYLTVDPRLQAAAQLSTAQVLNQPDDPSSAMVSIDDNGRIVALIGGQNFDASEVNYALGKAGGGSGRGPGSTFKTIALAEYVNEGYSVKSEKWAPAGWIFPELDDGKPWGIQNYEEKDLGKLTVEQATWESANTVFAQIMLEITPEKFVEMAQKLGITGNVPAEPSAVLGSGEVSVLDMATAYSTLSNRGTRKPPYIIRRVEAADGTVLYDVSTDPEKQPTPDVIPPAVADTVNSTLAGVINNPLGTGYRARLKTKAVGKTGTTDDYRDAWFAGFTCRITTVVWMGYDNKPGEAARLMDAVRGDKKVTGGSFPADIWKSYMTAATEGARGCAFTPTDAGTNVEPLDDRYAPTTTTTAPPVAAPPPDGAAPPAGGAPAAPTTTAAPG